MASFAFPRRGPRIVRAKGRIAGRGGWQETDEGGWADVWHYQGFEMAIIPGFAAAGKDQNWLGAHWDPMTYDDMLPGCYEQSARLADMDRNHTEASLSFPTFPRFCGQTFLEYGSRELGLACVQAYNDWMIEEWCAGDGRGRLIPLTLIPLWDPELAAAEVRRCADKGSYAICFSENPVPNLKLPSIHTDALGSALRGVSGDRDGRQRAHRLVFDVPGDQLGCAACGLAGFDVPGRRARPLRLADLRRPGPIPDAVRRLIEGQVGWIPYLLERLDQVWNERPVYGNIEALTKPPSAYFREQIFGCVYDDVAGLRLRDTDRHEPDHVRGRLPARRLHLAEYPRRRREDRSRSRTVRGASCTCSSAATPSAATAWSASASLLTA